MGGLPTTMWTSLHPCSTALLSTCTRSMFPSRGSAGPDLALGLQLDLEIVRVPAGGDGFLRGDDLRLHVLQQGLIEGLHLVEGDRVLDGLADGADLVVLDQLLHQRR